MSFSFKNIFKKGRKFKESGNTVVYTTTYVMHEKSTITLVSHELNGDWQFMGNESLENFQEIGLLVSLFQVIKIDNSILSLVDLPIGYQATRVKKSDEWKIEKIHYSESEIQEMGYYCSECGEFHGEIPMSYGAESPTSYFNLDEETKNQSELTRDICIINRERFFIKGQIKIKVDTQNKPFTWNVWVEIGKEDFDIGQENWTNENRFLRKPYNGVIDTPLNCYSNTLGLKVKVQTQKVGIIPEIIISETNHPLFFEQENGINMDRVTGFAKKILYAH
ncbi:DUF2199 domain-containing protein [Seonamhaeicola maritimus]|uniref:DUF2199 domain-containing protein n=1 Tax=Seonamhaeicola maritimus TaxID=2591822 RepID=A0A5C7GLS7_9FLAO|nr:DUF2199 domain-containing protein [Seonamhaeicola maritimus]TXG39298.1 DUF2199 domain-containing protein [Seonamhaeicola maritimus]